MHERWPRVSRADGAERCGRVEHLHTASADAASRAGFSAQQLCSLPPSTAHLNLYVGLSQSDSALGLQGTNLWLYPSFDHDANVERFSRDFAQNADSPFPGVYLSFSSAKDPDFQRRHPGKSTVEVIAMVPYAAFAAWADSRWRRRGDDYDTLKQRLTERMLAELERQAPSEREDRLCGTVYAGYDTPLHELQPWRDLRHRRNSGAI